MGSVARPSPRFEVFDPELAAVMGLAFDTAWQVLMVTEGELVSPLRAERTREALALRIITLVQLGERDVLRLHDDALAHVRRLADPHREQLPRARRLTSAELGSVG